MVLVHDATFVPAEKRHASCNSQDKYWLVLKGCIYTYIYIYMYIYIYICIYTYV